MARFVFYYCALVWGGFIVLVALAIIVSSIRDRIRGGG